MPGGKNGFKKYYYYERWCIGEDCEGYKTPEMVHTVVGKGALLCSFQLLFWLQAHYRPVEAPGRVMPKVGFTVDRCSHTISVLPASACPDLKMCGRIFDLVLKLGYKRLYMAGAYALCECMFGCLQGSCFV